MERSRDLAWPPMTSPVISTDLLRSAALADVLRDDLGTISPDLPQALFNKEIDSAEGISKQLSMKRLEVKNRLSAPAVSKAWQGLPAAAARAPPPPPRPP